VQLAGGHIDAHVNNPSESIGQWKGSTQRPLAPSARSVCLTGQKSGNANHVTSHLRRIRLDFTIPAPRTVWLPGKITPDQATFYVDLMKKVQATPEWKEYIERTSQTDTFLTGDAFSKFIKEDVERTRKVAADEGWLISN
jgi:tripartite-type tricarboxylate transporter receptor subunit TctC